MSDIHSGKLAVGSTELLLNYLPLHSGLRVCGLLLLPEACACPVLDQTTGTQSFLANSDLPMARSLVEVLQIT